MNMRNVVEKDFCSRVKCINPEKERMAIAGQIAKILRKDALSKSDKARVERYKQLYDISLGSKRGELNAK